VSDLVCSAVARGCWRILEWRVFESAPVVILSSRIRTGFIAVVVYAGPRVSSVSRWSVITRAYPFLPSRDPPTRMRIIYNRRVRRFNEPPRPMSTRTRQSRPGTGLRRSGQRSSTPSYLGVRRRVHERPGIVTFPIVFQTYFPLPKTSEKYSLKSSVLLRIVTRLVLLSSRKF